MNRGSATIPGERRQRTSPGRRLHGALGPLRAGVRRAETFERRALRFVARLGEPGARAQGWLESHFAWFAAALAAAAVANELLIFGPAISDWDALYLSGVTTFLFGLRLGATFRPRFESALERLVRGKTFIASKEEHKRIEDAMNERARALAHTAGVLIAAAIVVAFVIAVPGQIVFTLLAAAGAYPVGRYIGEAIAYGGLARACRQEGIGFDLQAGHLDGAAGWRLVGDLYFKQALLLAVPAVFLGVWWFLIPAFEGYDSWRDAYAVLLLIVVACQVLAFVLPLLSFHGVMSELKRGLLAKADEYGHRVVTLRDEIAAEPDAARRKDLKDELESLTDQYLAIESLPTWPVAAPTRRKFAFNNAVFAIPLIAALLDGESVSWADIGSALGSWFSA